MVLSHSPEEIVFRKQLYYFQSYCMLVYSIIIEQCVCIVYVHVYSQLYKKQSYRCVYHCYRKEKFIIKIIIKFYHYYCSPANYFKNLQSFKCFG